MGIKNANVALWDGGINKASKVRGRPHYAKIHFYLHRCVSECAFFSEPTEEGTRQNTSVQIVEVHSAASLLLYLI